MSTGFAMQIFLKDACDGALEPMSTQDSTEFNKKFGFIGRHTDELRPGMVKYHSA